MNSGEKIAELRRKHGMTQDDLGKAMNVSYQAVSKWERNESQPDFETMSKIAKLFNVPLSYFEDGAHASAQFAYSDATAAPVQKTFIGTCTECGRVVYEGEECETQPKLVCGACLERKRESQRQVEQKRAEELARWEAENPDCEKKEKRSERLSAVGNKLGFIFGILGAVAMYVLFIVLYFLDTNDDRMIYGALLFLAPLAAFGGIHAIVNKVKDLFDKEENVLSLRASLIIAACFSLVYLALLLTMYLTTNSDGEKTFLIGLMIGGTLLTFTFISQYLWGGVVGEIFTCGGFTFKIPLVLFTFSPDGIIALIVTKILLGILAVIIYAITTIIFALVAILGSVFIFIPSLIATIRREKKEKAEN